MPALEAIQGRKYSLRYVVTQLTAILRARWAQNDEREIKWSAPFRSNLCCISEKEYRGSCKLGFEWSGMLVWRQLSCPVRDNYDGRLSGLTFNSFQSA